MAPFVTIGRRGGGVHSSKRFHLPLHLGVPQSEERRMKNIVVNAKLGLSLPGYAYMRENQYPNILALCHIYLKMSVVTSPNVVSFKQH